MARSNSNIEHTNVERLEFFIIETLTKRGKIGIPDFGHLELRTVGDRRTVFFVPAEKDGGSFMQIMSAVNEKEKTGANSLYTAVTIPLKAERTVTLPKVGVFRPCKRDDGTTRITFIPSSSLRKTLSELDGTDYSYSKEDEKEIIEDIVVKNNIIVKEDVISKKNNILEEAKEDVIEVKEEVKEAVKAELKEIKVERTERTFSARERNVDLPKREPVRTSTSEIKTDTKFRTAELPQRNTETTRKDSLSAPSLQRTTRAAEVIVPPVTDNSEKLQPQVEFSQPQVERTQPKVEKTPPQMERIKPPVDRFNPPKVERPPKVSEPHVPREDVPESHRVRNISGTVLFLITILVIIVFVAINFRTCKIKKVDEQNQVELLQKPTVGVIDLASLAEKHYGHPAFWVYIYAANSEKLSSPLNIPEDIPLDIPDLAADYNVDISDSLEINRANFTAGVILNRLKTKK